MTTTKLQAPNLGQPHKECGRIKHVCERLTLTIT